MATNPVRRARRLAPTLIAAAFAMAVAAPALAGEIKDENEELEKIVWAVDAESERDPELSVGGERVQVEPGDLITFRIGINEDDVVEGEDGIAVIDDVYKKADLEYVSSDAEFDPEDCDPPAEASDPAENKVTCRVTLGPDGNARLYLTFRVLPPNGNPQACVPGTNVVNTDGASSAAEGGDQAQYEICPEGTLAGTGSATPTPSLPANDTDAGGEGALPDTATSAELPNGWIATAAAIVALAATLLVNVSLLVVERRRD